MNATPRLFGFISVETHPRESRLARCRVNGMDVTRDTYAADDVHGFADVWSRDANGRHYLGPDGRVAHERLHGHVEIDFPRGLE